MAVVAVSGSASGINHPRRYPSPTHHQSTRTPHPPSPCYQLFVLDHVPPAPFNINKFHPSLCTPQSLSFTVTFYALVCLVPPPPKKKKIPIHAAHICSLSHCKMTLCHHFDCLNLNRRPSYITLIKCHCFCKFIVEVFESIYNCKNVFLIP